MRRGRRAPRRRARPRRRGARSVASALTFRTQYGRGLAPNEPAAVHSLRRILWRFDRRNIIESFDTLDDLDVRLLDALQRNGRSTFAELGVLVGLKPPAVHDRVKRLESRGFIRGYAARLDPRRLGLELAAFVSVYTTADVEYDAFHAAVARLPEVVEVHSVAGDESFVLKVLTRSTGHLDDFLSRLKAVRGIARTRTTIVLSSPFERDGIALDADAATDLRRTAGASA